MNILIDALPETVEIDGDEWPINCDFRSCLRTILAFEDNDLAPQEKQTVMLTNLYPKIPENIAAATQQAGWFLNGGKEEEEDQEITGARVYSFAKDAGYIYIAFRQTYEIDLQKDNLHWWEFLALFMDLGSETTFCQLVSLRKRLKDGTATEEERKMAAAMGEMIDIPELDDRTIEEKEMYEAFMAAVREGEKN